MLLHERLRQLRTKHKVTLAQVASGTGYSVGYICDLEHARTDPSLSCLTRLANYYRLSIVGLLLPVFFPDAEVEQDFDRQLAIDNAEMRQLLKRYCEYLTTGVEEARDEFLKRIMRWHHAENDKWHQKWLERRRRRAALEAQDEYRFYSQFAGDEE